MRPCLLVATVAVVNLTASMAHAAPAHVWSQRYAHDDDQWFEKVVVDPFGNIVACGSFYTSLDLGAVYPSAGFNDGFVAKFDPNGNLLWVHQLGDVRPDRAWDVTTDLVGNVICCGTLSSDINDSDVMIVKYAPDGTLRWLKRFGPGDLHYQSAMCVSTNLSKDIIVAGEFDGAFDLGGATLQPTGGLTFFMARLDTNGNHIWSKRFFTRTPYVDNLSGIETGADGQTTFCGALLDSLDVGNGVMKSAGQYDVFLARFDANGNALWSKRFGDAQSQVATDIAVNAAGQIAVIGFNNGSINFGGGPLSAGSDYDPFVAVLSSTGNNVWSKTFNGTVNQYATSLTWASNHDLIVACEGSGSLDFGNGVRTIAGPGSGVWLARFFGSSGAARWSSTLTSDGDMEARIEEDDGKIILAGSVSGTVNLGGGETTGQADYLDLVVGKFSDVLTGVSKSPVITELGQNVPNPFNPSTRIPFTVEERARVRIEIYNVSGQRITLLDAGDVPAGAHSLTWNGRDARGRTVASGMYFYRLEGSADAPRKMVLLK